MVSVFRMIDLCVVKVGRIFLVYFRCFIEFEVKRKIERKKLRLEVRI